MAVIKPFFAVRPHEGLEDKIAALPYDVYSRKEAKEKVQGDNYTFLRIDRAESQFPDDIDTYDPCVYQKARELYENMKEEGSFIKEGSPCFYLYEQTMNGRKQTGLVCLSSVDEYLDGIIKKHENTREDKELDRINHVDVMDAQTGPIFLAYRAEASINDFLENIKVIRKPYFDFVSDDGIEHKAWRIDADNEISFLTDAFSKIPNLYIADGHHRCASAAKVSLMRREKFGNDNRDAEYNYFLSVIFPDSELMIMDYNRVIKDMNGMSDGFFMASVTTYFNIKEIPVSDLKPAKKGDIYMFFRDREYVLNLKKRFISDDPIESLDVSVLQRYLLEPYFGIKDPKTDQRIDFVGGIRGVPELRKRLSKDACVAFAMYPTLMSELFNVADAGLLMPPKSTWFEPKLRSGLFIHELS